MQILLFCLVYRAVCCSIPPSNLFKPNITLVFINHGYLPQHIILQTHIVSISSSVHISPNHTQCCTDTVALLIRFVALFVATSALLVTFDRASIYCVQSREQ